MQQVPQHPRPKPQHARRSPSSSGSETCTSLPAKKSNRLTKFCHECGTKYPLDCAKFCVECGIKRLVLWPNLCCISNESITARYDGKFLIRICFSLKWDFKWIYIYMLLVSPCIFRNIIMYVLNEITF